MHLKKKECSKDLINSEQGPVSGSGDNDNEYSDSKIGDGCPDCNCQILTNSTSLTEDFIL
jgi:hypothetical protein